MYCIAICLFASVRIYDLFYFKAAVLAGSDIALMLLYIASIVFLIFHCHVLLNSLYALLLSCMCLYHVCVITLRCIYELLYSSNEYRYVELCFPDGRFIYVFSHYLRPQ